MLAPTLDRIESTFSTAASISELGALNRSSARVSAAPRADNPAVFLPRRTRRCEHRVSLPVTSPTRKFLPRPEGVSDDELLDELTHLVVGYLLDPA